MLRLNQRKHYTLCLHGCIQVLMQSKANGMTKNQAHPKHIRWSRIRYTKPMMATIKLIFLKARRRWCDEQPWIERWKREKKKVRCLKKKQRKLFDVTLTTFSYGLWMVAVLRCVCVCAFFCTGSEIVQCVVLTFFSCLKFILWIQHWLQIYFGTHNYFAHGHQMYS